MAERGHRSRSDKGIGAETKAAKRPTRDVASADLRTRRPRGASASRDPIFTIGHSTRPIDAFIELLKRNGVRRVVDVRTVPKSRTNPQYNADALAASLERAGIGYTHIAALGGLKSKRRDVDPAVNAFWQNQSFHNYADYAMTSAFRAGLTELRVMARDERCAIMCAEAVWWRCHRRIITDYLLSKGEPVFHIVGEARAEPAKITPAATPAADGSLAYPASQPELGL